MAYTPGPWEAQQTGLNWSIHRKTSTIDGGYFAEVEPLHRTDEAIATCRDNAKLIAAAPELLKACQIIQDRILQDKLGKSLLTVEERNDINYAVAKATGRTA